MTVEIATELGFAKIGPGILEMATEIFQNHIFDLSHLEKPETQFKLALLDGIVRQFEKTQMPGVRAFRDLSLSDQRQLVWNIQKIATLLDSAFNPGKKFTKNQLETTITRALIIEKELATTNGPNDYLPTRLADGSEVILDLELWRTCVSWVKVNS